MPRHGRDEPLLGDRALGRCATVGLVLGFATGVVVGALQGFVLGALVLGAVAGFPGAIVGAALCGGLGARRRRCG